MNDRKLKPKPVEAPGPIESLLNDIRSMPKLKPVKNGRLVGESSSPARTSARGIVSFLASSINPLTCVFLRAGSGAITHRIRRFRVFEIRGLKVI